MYNRYIPQADGSYRRNRIQDSRPSKETNIPPVPPPPPVQQHQTAHEPQSQTCSNCIHRAPQRQSKSNVRSLSQNYSVGNFLRQLLPKDFDIEDLLVILLLLLMSGDCQEEQNTALLTLALYLFL